MSAISGYINQIQNAVYGEKVQKQLVKREEIKKLFDRYGVEY